MPGYCNKYLSTTSALVLVVLRRSFGWSLGLGGGLICAIVASATVGPAEIGAVTAGAAILNMFAVPVPTGGGLDWIHPFAFTLTESTQTIVSGIRLPRILLGAVVGFALATAGTVFQGFFRNPMADPSIIGVSTGAATGAVAYVVTPLTVPYGLPAAAFVGGLVTGGAVYLIATEGGQTPVATLLLAGIAVQAFLGAVISYLLLHAGESLERVVYWLMGHLHASTWWRVWIAAPPVIILFGVLLTYARDLNVLMLGEEHAHALGLDVTRTKQTLLAGASVVTAAAVAVSGVIGFVGLIVPHIMRLLVGPDHRILLPSSALAGASFLVITDTIARSGAAELPVGIITAAIGAPFFLYLLIRTEGHTL